MVPPPDPSPDVVDTITKVVSLLRALKNRIFSSPGAIPESTSLPDMAMVRDTSSSVSRDAMASMTGTSLTGFTVSSKFSTLLNPPSSITVTAISTLP